MLGDILRRDFGGKSLLARHGAAALQGALASLPGSRVQALLAQWSDRLGGAGGLVRNFTRTDLHLLFAVQTYYAILVRLLALQALYRHTVTKPDQELAAVANRPADELAAYLRANLERGEIFNDLGLKGFTVCDFFDWYLDAWNEPLEQVLRATISAIAGYPLAVTGADAGGFHDPLQGLYQELIPARWRHSLGEYYTPGWLAERLLDRVMAGEAGGDLDLNKKVLDPACGSGAFLVLTVYKMRRYALENRMSAAGTLAAVLANVAGFDVNPLAVMTARTNYLLAIADLLPSRRGDTVIPVFETDAILAPGLGRPEFDLVIGNPPWINWESVPDAYRRRTRPLWESYGLFPHGGMDTILGQGKKDLSMLLTYVVLDRYLKHGGKLGFVITQSVFKSPGAAQGFRRFVLPDGTPVRVTAVDDMVELQPFTGASNRTALVVLQKGLPNRYPVKYSYWRRMAPGDGINSNLTLAEVQNRVRVLPFVGRPVAASDSTSAWITGRKEAVRALRKVLGPSAYQAHQGINTGGANGVYWVEVAVRRPDGLVVVDNVAAGTKRKVTAVRHAVEPDLLYPLLRSRDTARWRATPALAVIMVQDPDRRRGIPEAEMIERYPETYGYLRRFEEVLRLRSVFRRYFTRRPAGGRVVETGPFYSMFDVGRYSLAPYKVVWGRIAAAIGAAVAGSHEGKPVLPQETLTFVGTEHACEAHYICAVINSLPFNFAAQSYAPRGGKSFGSIHILKYLCVPAFDRTNPLHLALASLSERAHACVAGGATDQLATIEEEIDQLAAGLYRLTAAELAAIREALVELATPSKPPVVT